MNCLWRALDLGAPGQAAPAGDTPDDLKARLEFMKSSMTTHEVRRSTTVAPSFGSCPIRSSASPTRSATRRTAPFPLARRSGSSRRRVPDPVESPADLAAGILVALPEPFDRQISRRARLEPSRGGVSFKPVPDAPRPADTAERRLRQMRQLAEGFSAEHHYRGTTWNQLRMLIKPFARYGKPGSDVQDGALFCFAHGTDPEALLMLESRPGKDGPEWQYAFAPMTGFAINAFWKGKEVWSMPPEANGWAGTRPIPFTLRTSILGRTE